MRPFQNTKLERKKRSTILERASRKKGNPMKSYASASSTTSTDLPGLGQASMGASACSFLPRQLHIATAITGQAGPDLMVSVAIGCHRKMTLLRIHLVNPDFRSRELPNTVTTVENATNRRHEVPLITSIIFLLWESFSLLGMMSITRCSIDRLCNHTALRGKKNQGMENINQDRFYHPSTFLLHSYKVDRVHS